MFEFLFGYPLTAYAQGKLSLLSGWPRPLLILLAINYPVAHSERQDVNRSPPLGRE